MYKMIHKLYWHHRAVVKTDDDKTHFVEIQRDCRQGCSFALLLLGLYSDAIYKIINRCGSGNQS